MREYETIYVLKPDLPSEQIKSIQKKLQETLNKAGGHVLHHVDWGKRRLAYRVDKFHQAYYVYLQYLDKGASVAELERILKYDDRVLKFLTVKLKEAVDVEARLVQNTPAPSIPEEMVSEAAYGRPPARARHPREEGAVGEAEDTASLGLS